MREYSDILTRKSTPNSETSKIMVVIDMKKYANLIFLFFGLVLFVGCSGSKMSVVQPNNISSRTVNRIAIAPDSGVLGDAIGLELFNRGLTVVDTNEAVAIVGRVGLQTFEVTTKEGFTILRENGIDAVLVVKSVAATDGTPESASVRLTDTENGNIIVGITWQNGYGGMRGSVADRTMRKNLSQAANEIAKELVRRLGSTH